MTKARTTLCGLMMAACCGGCTLPRSHVREPQPVRTASSLMSLTSDELMQLEPQRSLMSALQRSRPWFLRSRGSTPLVIVDGSPVTGSSILEALMVRDILDVRLVRASSGVSLSVIGSEGRVIVGDILFVRTRVR